MPSLSKQSPAVLVVDDNPLIVNILTSLLKSQNYEVFTAINGLDALELLDKREVDLIICDVMMPKMDGYRFQEKVRERSNLGHVPFVFLTALSEGDEVCRGMESGADDYMMKPFDPRELLSMVQGKVHRSQRLRALSEESYESYRKRVVHTLSHEFRTPLVAINTGTELLIENKGSLEESKVENLLEAIRRGGQRLERLVNDFMVMQQIEAGVAIKMVNTRSEAVLISETLQNFYEDKSPELINLGFKVLLDIQAPNIKVNVYEPHILDIFRRILENSVKFSIADKDIEMCLYRASGDVIIEIRDRGMGIDADRVEEAVNVFGQLDRDKLEQQGGGLGLAICNRYATLNGGSLEFRGRPGGGSVVSLILPALS